MTPEEIRRRFPGVPEEASEAADQAGSADDEATR
jgi:hypothetical protein